MQVYRLIKLDPRVHRGQSLIHLACSPETSTVGRFVICNFPNLNVLNLLFELGADPNCADVDGQRPIGHILTQRRLNSSDLVSSLDDRNKLFLFVVFALLLLLLFMMD